MGLTLIFFSDPPDDHWLGRIDSLEQASAEAQATLDKARNDAASLKAAAESDATSIRAAAASELIRATYGRTFCSA